MIGLLIGTLRFARNRERSTRALEATELELREALQLKDEFVAIVSHELRTPINTIAGWARMLEGRTLRPGRTDNAIAAIARNAESLRHLVEDLMDTTQLVSGRLRLAISAVNVREVVMDAMETVRLSADNKGVTLDGPMDSGETVVVQGDAARLKQIVWNILSNAIKFTPSGGRVEVRLAAAADSVRIQIRDTGAGIDVSFLPHVFDRFRQGKATDGQQGLGLGLAIVRHLVELHGGTVTAHSAGLGAGATFTIDLPALGADAVSAEMSWTRR